MRHAFELMPQTDQCRPIPTRTVATTTLIRATSVAVALLVWSTDVGAQRVGAPRIATTSSVSAAFANDRSATTSSLVAPPQYQQQPRHCPAIAHRPPGFATATLAIVGGLAGLFHGKAGTSQSARQRDGAIGLAVGAAIGYWIDDRTWRACR